MRCDEIGVKVSKQEFVDFLNGVKGGQFFHIRGYKAQNDAGKVSDDPNDPDGLSEISDIWARFGIKYDRFRARDVATLRSILSGEKQDMISITHGAWVPEGVPLVLDLPAIAVLPNRSRAELVNAKITKQVPIAGTAVSAGAEMTGTVNLLDVTIFSNRKAKGRIPVTVHYRLPMSHPLVVAAIGAEDLQGTLLQGLLNPAPVTTDYEKQAQSFFSLDRADGRTMWYLRDVAVVRKIVRRQGTYKFKASLPLVAVKSAIESKFLTKSKYRTYIFNEGNFIGVNITGQAILVDGTDEQTYFALPEDVKAAVEAEVATEILQ